MSNEEQSRILNYGLTTRPCWLGDIPLKDLTIKDVRRVDEAPVEGVIYYAVVGDHGFRYRAYQADGLPPFVWAPDGYELPGNGETVDVKGGKLWGYYVLIFDWEWFISLEKLHDGIGGKCRICSLMRARADATQEIERFMA